MTESNSQPASKATISPENTAVETTTSDEVQEIRETIAAAKPEGSYVKLAMRNMVRKGRQSLWHFFLTTVGLVGLLVGLAYLTKP